jgi:hypothetical protein
MTIIPPELVQVDDLALPARRYVALILILSGVGILQYGSRPASVSKEYGEHK